MGRKKTRPQADDEISSPEQKSTSSVKDELGFSRMADENATKIAGDNSSEEGKHAVDNDEAEEKKLVGKKKSENRVAERGGIAKKRKSMMKKGGELVEAGNALERKRKRGPDVEIMETYLLLSHRNESSSRLRPRKKVPSFQRVTLDKSDFSSIVGKRVKVFWPDSRRWFYGHIASFNRKKMVHVVLYDDGDKEELNLMKERFELEVMPDDVFCCSDAELKVEPEKREMSSCEGKVDEEGIVEKEDFCEEGVTHLKKKSALPKKGKGGSSMQQDKKDDARNLEKTVHLDLQADVLHVEGKKKVVSKECNITLNLEDDNDKKLGGTELVLEALDEIDEASVDAQDTEHEISNLHKKPEMSGKEEDIENNECQGDETKVNRSEEKKTWGIPKTDYSGLQIPVNNQEDIGEVQAGLESLDTVSNRGLNTKSVYLQLPADGKPVEDEGLGDKVHGKGQPERGI